MQQPPNQSTSGPTEQLRSDAQQLGSTAANRVHSEVDARKDTAATQAKSVSSAIQRAAGELDDGSPAWLKSAFRQGADQIQRFAETLERKDSREIFDDVQSFARERPALFLGACAAAGFAAARIFKAGGEQQQSQQFSQSGSFDVDQPRGDGEVGFTERATGQGPAFGQTPSPTGEPRLDEPAGTPPISRGEFV